MAIVTNTSCDTMRLLKLPDGYAHLDTFVNEPLGEAFTKSSHTGNGVWTDGTNLYHSEEWEDSNFIWNPETRLWEPITFEGYVGQHSGTIWTDGENIYSAYGNNDYIFNKETKTWETKQWAFTDVTNTPALYTMYIWTDDDNVYYSDGGNNFILNKETSTWEPVTWNGLSYIYGYRVWSDGENIYYSSYSDQYILDKETSTWKQKQWRGLTSMCGEYIWTDGTNMYYSTDDVQRILNKETSTWELKTWYGLTRFSIYDLHCDGMNIHCILNGDPPVGLVLLPANTKLGSKVNGTWSVLDRFIVPTGTTEINTNGVHDVVASANVKVSVPMPGQYIVDTLNDLPTNAVVGSLAIVIGGE